VYLYSILSNVIEAIGQFFAVLQYVKVMQRQHCVLCRDNISELNDNIESLTRHQISILSLYTNEIC